MATFPKLRYLPDFEGRDTLYQQLNPLDTEVRVLSLWPNDDFSAPLESSMSIQSIFGGEKHYHALSYYWGLANDLSYVIVHGSDEGAPTNSCKVPITKNLDTFLRHLRIHGLQRIWTNAWYINQRDAEERSWQVQEMRSIFEHADSVEIWLSDYTRSTGNGLLALNALCDHGGMYGLINCTLDGFDIEYDLEHGKSTGTFYEDIEALLDLPYWRRGWMFQKACANQNVFLRLGHIKFQVKCWQCIQEQLHQVTEWSQWDPPYQPRGGGKNLILDLSYGLVPFIIASQHLVPPSFKIHDEHQVMMFESKAWQTTDPRG